MAVKMLLSKNGTNPRALCWPSWRLDINWWLTIISFILGFLVFFFPKIEDNEFKRIRIGIGVFLLALPFLLPLIIWCWRSFEIALQRIASYPILFEQQQRSIQELYDAKKSIFEIAINKRAKNAFELLNARVERDTLYISIKKNSAQKLSAGDVLVVIHKDDYKLMGVFQVSEVLSGSYHARAKSNIDALWISYLYEKGESNFMPNMVAIFVTRGVE